MGCDIHMHTEIKISNKWEHYTTPDVDRDYSWFAKLAGVRGGGRMITPISLPKGMPQDASVVTMVDYKRWGSDGHSHTWLSADELAEFCVWAQNAMGNDGWRFEMDRFCYLFGNSWESWRKYRDDYPAEIEDIRWVFWFDN